MSITWRLSTGLLIYQCVFHQIFKYKTITMIVIEYLFFPFLSLSLSFSALPPPHLNRLDDIEIIFYEDKADSSMQSSVQPWTAKGRFGPNDVHHQYAIVFQTPPFYNLAVERPIQVLIALRRPSDSELSEPKPFLYLPQEFGALVWFVNVLYRGLP